jgi:pimeloyl-ACP methyl ester carboxylesterase
MKNKPDVKRLLSGLPVSERRLMLAGVSTPVLEGGDGPPVVLLHGPGAYGAHWMEVIPGLVSACRVVVPDLPGLGASQVSDGALDADRVLSWLGELIERTCASPPVLVGQTLGGAIAARFASRGGDRLSRLVLIDPFGMAPFQPAPEFGLALTRFLADPTRQTHESLWRLCAHDLDGLRERMGERWEPFEEYNLDRARTPSVQAALAAYMQQFGAAIPPEDLARISVPTALIWGRHDLAIPLALGEAASARYGWPLYVIENAADDPPVEQPEALVRVLRVALAAPDRETSRMARRA